VENDVGRHLLSVPNAGVTYLVVAVSLCVVCYRWNMPLTMRSAFYPVGRCKLKAVQPMWKAPGVST